MGTSGWKVVVSDELGITRRAIAGVIRKADERHEVVECSTVERVMAALAEGEPTLLLVDLKNPGLHLVASARAVHPGLKIVVLAGYDSPEDALYALKAGADGFLVKGMSPEELMTCLQCVVETGVVVTSRVFKRTLDHLTLVDRADTEEAVNDLDIEPQVIDSLTFREREIFDLMAQAYSNKEIAASLHIAEQTVKAHVSRILTKLGQPNRARAVIHGLRTRTKVQVGAR